MRQSIKPVKLSIPGSVEGSEKVLLPGFTKRVSVAENVNGILEMTADQCEGDGIKRQGFSSSLTDEKWHLRAQSCHLHFTMPTNMTGIGLTSVGLQDTDFTQEVS